MDENTVSEALKKNQLEKLFGDGAIPKGADFKSLISSMVNKIDDGFDKDDKNGLIIRNIGDEKENRFISLYKNSNDTQSFFSIERDDENTALILNPGTGDKEKKPEIEEIKTGNKEVKTANEKGKKGNYTGLAFIIFSIVLFLLAIKIVSYGWLVIGGIVFLFAGSIMLIKSRSEQEKEERPEIKEDSGENQEESRENTEDKKQFYFGINGNMGVGRKAQKHLKLDVNGFVGMKGRIGNYEDEETEPKDRGTAKANAQWHTILNGLDNCTGWEIIARAGGRQGSGRHAIVHAIAISAFGKSKGRIRKTSSHYGFFWNKLILRWVSKSPHEYSLQIRTIINYGEGGKISYRITQLWDDKFFGDPA